MPIVSSFITSTTDPADATIYTFASQSFGAEAANRYIIVSFGAASATASRTLSSATIGGVSASILLQTSIAGSSRLSGIIVALVPNGTTGDVVLTFSAGMDRCGIGIYRATGLLSTSAYDTAQNSATSGTSVSTNTIDCPAGGLIIATSQSSATATTNHTYAGVTEDFDNQLENSTHRTSGGSLSPSTTQTNLTVSVTLDVTINVGASLTVVSFEPSPVNSLLALLGVGA